MSERRQFIGHATAEARLFTGLDRELTVDTQLETLRVHDGVTPGGHPLAKADLSNVNQSTMDTLFTNFGAERTANKVTSLSGVTSSQQFLNAQALIAYLSQMHAIGDLKYSLIGTNHNGWLLCNGQAISRVTYSALFNVIGTNFGAGDGATTFNVPNYSNAFLRMVGDQNSNMFASQAEGLPNCEGYFDAVHNDGYNQVSGMFSFETSPRFHGEDANKPGYRVKASLAAANPIYGNSSHVTPYNYSTNIFIYAGFATTIQKGVNLWHLKEDNF